MKTTYNLYENSLILFYLLLYKKSIHKHLIKLFSRIELTGKMPKSVH